MTPEIIIGPPGTGKTTTLLGIVEEALERGVEPEHIGYVSFTRRAAHEARDRARERFGLSADRFPWFRTLHSLCFRALGLSNSDVLEGRKMSEFGDWIGIQVTGSRPEDGNLSMGMCHGDRILFMENLARIRGVPLREQYDSDSDDLSWHEVERVSRGLAEYKRAHGLQDYTDMLDMFSRQDWAPSLELLLVDEAQDLSMLQWRVVERLARDARRVVVAGDDDQAIYSWAGAAVEHFVGMPGQVRVLEQSWRVPSAVQKIAASTLVGLRQRRDKAWAPRPEEGLVRQMPIDGIEWTGPSILVLARNIMHLREIERRIHASGYMYESRGHPSIRDSLRRCLLTWERLRRGEAQLVEDVVRVYDLMSSGVGVARGHKELRTFPREAEVTMADLTQSGGLLRTDVWHDALDKVPPADREYIRACLRRGERMSQAPRIRLSTIHGSKGGEADEVVLLTDMAPRTHREALERPDDEVRVWYVAATRARQTLTIVPPRTERHFTFRWQEGMP